jgi:hypothetical protein
VEGPSGQVLLPRLYNKFGVGAYEGYYFISMYRVQKQKLFKHEKQEEYNRKDTDKKILQKLQETHFAQGNKILKGIGQ